MYKTLNYRKGNYQCIVQTVQYYWGNKRASIYSYLTEDNTHNKNKCKCTKRVVLRMYGRK